MSAHAEKSATLLARLDHLDDVHVRAALRAALLGFGELRPHEDPDVVLTGTLVGVERAMDAPATTGSGWRRERPGLRAS